MASYRIISADSHVSVPGELFGQFLPEKYRDDQIPNLIGSSLSSRQKAQFDPDMLKGPLAKMADAMRLASREGRPLGRVGGFDPRERLADMDSDRVDAEVLYGSITHFYDVKDPEKRRAWVRAYNDSLREWCAADHNRLIPVGEIPIDPVEDGVEELKRLAKLGYRTALIPAYPHTHGLPRYWDPRYAPLWATAQELDFPLSVHVGAGAWTAGLLAADPTPQLKIFQSLPPIEMSEILATFLLSDALKPYPNFKFTFVESGIGWIAYYLERLDTMHYRHGWFQVDKDLPSAVWYRQGAATFEEDKLGVLARDRLGVDNILWATDYPHPDSTWPDSQKVIDDHFAGVAEDDKRKIIYENAVKRYKLGG
jgi:predicted TIM-barrel fold metal-dependent hydrolase